MILYECVGAMPAEYEEYVDFWGHHCYHPNMPDVMKRCEGVTLAWAIGGNVRIWHYLYFPFHFFNENISKTILHNRKTHF